MTAVNHYAAEVSSVDGKLRAFWMLVAFALAPALAFLLLLFLANFDTAYYHARIEAETGWLEISHIIVPLLAAAMALRLALVFRRDGQAVMTALMIFAVVAGLFVAGEEASYGQHFFKWEADGFFLAFNDQQETNLHNIGTWFDQKPRALLEIVTILAGMVIPFAPRRSMNWLPRIFRPYLPDIRFLPIAILIQLAEAPKRLGFAGEGVFPEIRYSEFQELFLYYFLVLALWFIGERQRAETLKRDISDERLEANPAY